MQPASLLSARASVLAVALLFISGCETTNTGPAASEKPTQTAGMSNSFDRLKEGLTEAEVRQLVGEPGAIRPFVSNKIESLVWIYEHKIDEVVEQIPIGTREIPLMNPLTGVMGTTKETIFANEHREAIETVEVLLLGQRVIAVKRSVRVEKRRV